MRDDRFLRCQIEFMKSTKLKEKRANYAFKYSYNQYLCNPLNLLHSLFNKIGSKTSGFTLAGLLIAISIMMILWSLAIPSWQAMNQREKELELIWRGEQYVKAIGRYYYKFGTYPPNLDILVDKKFLKKKYPDPFGPDGEWETLHEITSQREKDGKVVTNVGPVIGVLSQSTAQSIVWYNNMRHHNEWRFVFYPQGAPPGSKQFFQQNVPPQQPPRDAPKR